MTIQDRIRLKTLLCASPVLLASACGQPEPAQPDGFIDQAGADPDCLVVVWREQVTPDAEFDRSNDRVDGGAISCATGTSASQFNAAIADIREAARAKDKARMLEQAQIPLLYIDAQGNRRELTDRAMVEALFDEVFDGETLTLMQQLELERMTVAQGQGAFFELGALWMVADSTGGRPRIVTVNRQALDEAIAAVRAKSNG